MKKIKLFISILATIVLTFSLTGCGEIQKAETAVNNMFVSFEMLNFEEAQKYIAVEEINLDVLEQKGDLSPNYEMYMKALFDRLDYEIVLSEKIDSNTVNVTTKITAVDMKPVLGEFMTTAIQYAFSNAFSNPQQSEEEINKKMEELFFESATKPDLATVTTEVAIKVVQEDKIWRIVPDDVFVDALLGGFIEASDELSKSFREQ